MPESSSRIAAYESADVALKSFLTAAASQAITRVVRRQLAGSGDPSAVRAWDRAYAWMMAPVHQRTSRRTSLSDDDALELLESIFGLTSEIVFLDGVHALVATVRHLRAMHGAHQRQRLASDPAGAPVSAQNDERCVVASSSEAQRMERWRALGGHDTRQPGSNLSDSRAVMYTSLGAQLPERASDSETAGALATSVHPTHHPSNGTDGGAAPVELLYEPAARRSRKPSVVFAVKLADVLFTLGDMFASAQTSEQDSHALAHLFVNAGNVFAVAYVRNVPSLGALSMRCPAQIRSVALYAYDSSGGQQTTSYKRQRNLQARYYTCAAGVSLAAIKRVGAPGIVLIRRATHVVMNGWGPAGDTNKWIDRNLTDAVAARIDTYAQLEQWMRGRGVTPCMAGGASQTACSDVVYPPALAANVSLRL